MATGKRLADTASELNSAAVHLLRALRSTDRAAGLTPARLSALSVLVFGGPCPLGRLARTEDVAGPTMTRIVDGLCDLGLAERRPHPDGGRLVLVAADRGGRARHAGGPAGSHRHDRHRPARAAGGRPGRDRRRLPRPAPPRRPASRETD